MPTPEEIFKLALNPDAGLSADEINVGGVPFTVPHGPGKTVMITADGRFGVAVERITEANLEAYRRILGYGIKDTGAR